MNRRDFIRRSIGAVAAAAVPAKSVALLPIEKLSESEIRSLIVSTITSFESKSMSKVREDYRTYMNDEVL